MYKENYFSRLLWEIMFIYLAYWVYYTLKWQVIYGYSFFMCCYALFSAFSVFSAISSSNIKLLTFIYYPCQCAVYFIAGYNIFWRKRDWVNSKNDPLD